MQKFFSRVAKMFHPNVYKYTRYLLAIGAMFYFFEALIHGLGLPILEHDVIFEPTADRYIAIMALALGCLLVLVARDFAKYKTLFYLTMAMIGLTILNGFYINSLGGYGYFFNTVDLDGQIYWIGLGSIIWYPLTLVAWKKKA